MSGKIGITKRNVSLCFGGSPDIFIDNAPLSRIIPPSKNASVEDGHKLNSKPAPPIGLFAKPLRKNP
jgi:hypothetical protein